MVIALRKLSFLLIFLLTFISLDSHANILVHTTPPPVISNVCSAAVYPGPGVTDLATYHSSAYPAREFLYNPKDGFFYAAWVWRSGFGLENNHSLSVARTKDFQNWFNTCGALLPKPITPLSRATIDRVDRNQALTNNIKISLDSNSDPVITYQKKNSIGIVQVYNAVYKNSVWRIYQMTNWGNPNSVSGGGSGGGAGNGVGFSGLTVLTGNAFQNLIRSANDTLASSVPVSGSYRLVPLQNDLGYQLYSNGPVPFFPVPQADLNALNPVTITNQPLNLNIRGLNRPTVWNPNLKIINKVIFARDTASIPEQISNSAFISWAQTPANRDRAYDCSGNPTDESPIAPTATSAINACPAYFLSDLNVWEEDITAPGGWKKTFLDRAWSGSQVSFDFIHSGDKKIVSYYDSQRRMTLITKLDSQSWSQATKKVLSAPKYDGWDSHNDIVIQLDSDATIHVTGNLHSYGSHKTPLVYLKGYGFSASTVYSQSKGMSGYQEDQATYPYFQNVLIGGSKKLLFRYRQGVAGDGTSYLKTYDSLAREWRDLGIWLDGRKYFAPENSTELLGNLYRASITTRAHDPENLYLDISGWVCSKNYTLPAGYKIYVGGPINGGGTLISSGITDLANDDAAITSTCNSGWNLNRFRRTYLHKWFSAHSGKRIYLYAFTPGKSDNTLVSDSLIFP